MQNDQYKGSRIGYVIEETSAYFVSLLMSGAFLAKLTLELGFSDSLTAILSAFISIGCSFQMLALVWFRKGRVKKKVTAFYTINQLLFTLLYFIPFLSAGKTIKTGIFIVFMVVGYMLLNAASAPRANWFMALVPDKKRGRFTAMKEAVSLIAGIIFNFTMAGIIDHYEAKGDTRIALAICGGTIFLCMVAHSLSLILSKEKEPVPKENLPLKKEFKTLIMDKNVRTLIKMSCFWGICNNFAAPFYGTYIVKELGFTMTYVAVLSLVYAVSRVTSSIILGKYADKTSFARMLRICYVMVALGFLVAAFTTPSNGYITYTVHHILYAAAMGGINSAELNLIYDCVEPERRANALAIKQTLYGLCCFGATLLASPVLNYIQNSGNRFLGINVYAQQVLSVIAFTFTIILILYLSKRMKRIGKKVNQYE